MEESWNGTAHFGPSHPLIEPQTLIGPQPLIGPLPMLSLYLSASLALAAPTPNAPKVNVMEFFMST